ncbi:3 beta-hydroxysteroid dehydrogenase/Delta 5--_4-isomerase type 3 [Blattella germanica]|nr:3 beta-hydroxysteroid dehydrogenase/Delta 5-->4-isomerase type 3 [Blattella germanica]
MADRVGQGEVVLVTGGSGFLGQHVVKLIQERDLKVCEIRVLDLKPYTNRLGHKERLIVKQYVGDIVDIASVRGAFRGVDCVFHCAALVDYQYPPDYEALDSVNVAGTQNVISLCLEFRVPRLVFSSTTEVTLTPYFGSIYSLVVNQTEKRALPPKTDNSLLLPGYPASKLRAERFVLDANGTPFPQGNGFLMTVALRPTLLYGELDTHIIPDLIRLSKMFNGVLPRFAGSGGRQQITYVGNAAWAHILAKNELLTTRPGGGIAGLPIFITDDTPVVDLLRFVERMSNGCRLSRWYFPSIFAYVTAAVIELLLRITKMRLPASPRGAVSYLGSLIMYSRLRADLHLDYFSIFQPEECYAISAKYYSNTEF